MALISREGNGGFVMHRKGKGSLPPCASMLYLEKTETMYLRNIEYDRKEE